MTLCAGIVLMPTHYAADQRDVARLLEDDGWESLFFPEHLHIPAERVSPFPLGTDLPKAYWHNLDPFAVMGATASVTQRLRFGTSITLVAQRDPILLAKTIATLDVLSAGRIEVGVGAGWNVEEMVNHGVDPARRWAVVREHVQAMQAIWSNDVASFKGEFVGFERICSWPKPVQKTGRGPGVPILIGGDGKHTVARIAGYGDGWLPVLDHDVDDFVARIREIRAGLAERNVPMPPMTVAYGFGRRVRPGELEKLAAEGVARILLALDPLPYDETVRALAGLRSQVAPVLAR